MAKYIAYWFFVRVSSLSIHCIITGYWGFEIYLLVVNVNV